MGHRQGRSHHRGARPLVLGDLAALQPHLGGGAGRGLYQHGSRLRRLRRVDVGLDAAGARHRAPPPLRPFLFYFRSLARSLARPRLAPLVARLDLPGSPPGPVLTTGAASRGVLSRFLPPTRTHARWCACRPAGGWGAWTRLGCPPGRPRCMSHVLSRLSFALGLGRLASRLVLGHVCSVSGRVSIVFRPTRVTGPKRCAWGWGPVAHLASSSPSVPSLADRQYIGTCLFRQAWIWRGSLPCSPHCSRHFPPPNRSGAARAS